LNLAREDTSKFSFFNINFVDFAACLRDFLFELFGELTKANRAELENYVDTFMRLLIAHTPVPSYLSCVLMC